jgi:glycosyltransferase involved in cell wall biosynthesis
MTKLAIVVQRCHESIVGGSEALAWQYATLLRDAYEVDVLTSCAVDYVTWANALPPGPESRDGITIHRFPVTLTRSPYWHELHGRWLRHYPYAGSGDVRTAAARPSPWTLGLEEEFIRQQGPFCKPLLYFLQRHADEYQAVFFITYLYPTTYFGSAYVPPERSLLVPTLHNEPAAYMKAFKHMARRMRGQLWLTESERQLSQDLWGELPGCIAATPVDTEPVAPLDLGYPYILYSGRIDTGKCSDQLVDFFLRFKKDQPSPLRLVLTGEDKLGLPQHPDILYRGYVPVTEKLALMAGASVFLMPSRWESFSLATLEAMAQRTPVLVNGACSVLLDHVMRSGGGKAYADYESFRAGLDELLTERTRATEMGERGRHYVVSRYRTERVRQLLVEQAEGSAQPLAQCA